MPFIISKNIDKIQIVFSLTEESQYNLLLVKSNEEFERVKINSFSQIQNVWNFINNNLPLREYNFSSKHGNKTTKAIPPKKTENTSQLLCTDDEANMLLKSAIFDLRERNWCYNFDDNQQTFIIFPCEGNNPQNKYHAFHINKDEWHKEIPNSIRKHFKK
jgi:hypothetical protein